MLGTLGIVLTSAVLIFPAAVIAQDNVLARYPIIDRNGFDKPVEAGSVMAPAGWQMQGGIVWRYDPCVQTTYGVALSVISPDGARSLTIHDVPGWTAVYQATNGMTPEQTQLPATTGMPQCVAPSYGSLGEFFRGHVPTMAPDAQVLEMRSRPDIIELSRAKGQMLPPTVEMAGVTINSWTEAGEALISFTVNGQPFRADLVCMIHFKQTDFPIAITQQQYSPPSIQRLLEGRPYCVSQAAPDGQLSFPLTDAFLKSVDASQQWQAQVQQAGRPRSGGSSATGPSDDWKAVAARTGINVDTANAVNNSIMGVGQAQADSFNTINGQITKNILGVENYVDPTTGNTVQLDNSYTNAWSTGDGGFIQSNNPNFNPNVELGIEARPMTPVE